MKTLNKKEDIKGVVGNLKSLLGSANGHWKGGVHRRKDGYELVRMGVIARKAKGARYKLKHRIVMEDALGRTLLRSEVVHHKNGNKSDNRIENLEITTQAEHARHHGLTDNPFKGKKHSQETIARIQKSRSWYKHTKATRRKQGLSLRRHYKEHPEALLVISRNSKRVALSRKRKSNGVFV